MYKPFFVMIYTQDAKSAVPMMDSEPNDDMPMFWATADDARSLADAHFYASSFGYEIFEMGTGE